MNEFDRKSDFHAHITSFENADSLLEKARLGNVGSLALIGRGELPSGVESLVKKAEDYGIKIFFGIEDIFSVGGQRKDFIIFNVDPSSPAIKDLYSHEKILQSSLKVLQKQIDFLSSQNLTTAGYDEESKLLLENLLAGQIYEKAINLSKLACSNPENLVTLNELWKLHGKEFTEQYKNSSFDLTKPTPKFIWWLYFTVGKPGYFNSERNPETVANIIHNENGFFIFSPESEDPDNEIEEVLTNRNYIDGVMGWHGDKLNISKRIIKWLRSKGKIILGGSDYNPLRDGEEKQWMLGVGKGEMFISPERFKRELSRTKK